VIFIQVSSARSIYRGPILICYIGINIVSGEEILIKFESIKAEYPQLENEARVYKSLAGGVGIPRVHWFGTECDSNVMILDYLGPSLEELFNFCNRKLLLRTVLLLADQLIYRIEYIYAKSFIHGDIKPDNLTMGIDKMDIQINVIGFGFAKEYAKAHSQIPHQGTTQCASINTHLGLGKSSRARWTR
jgi:serine/threonine protein kinase